MIDELSKSKLPEDIKALRLVQSAGKRLYELEKETKIEAEKIIRWKKEVGRNEKCPCSSGKKFKKCCSLK